MRRIKIPPQDFLLQMQGGGAYARGGAYLWDTTVYNFGDFMLHNTSTETSQLPQPVL